MELLHAIFAFNLVTSLAYRRCLCHSPARRHDHRRPTLPRLSFAGMLHAGAGNMSERWRRCSSDARLIELTAKRYFAPAASSTRTISA